MVDMLSQLRENSMSIQESLQTDSKKLDAASDLAESNLDKVRKEAGRMSKTCFLHFSTTEREGGMRALGC